MKTKTSIARIKKKIVKYLAMFWLRLPFNIFVIFVCFCLIESCDGNNKKVQEVMLKDDIKIEEFSDSTFFSDIRSISYSGGVYYLTDYSRDQIFVLDSNFKLSKTLGRKGQGPGEFLGAAHLCIDGDSVFVLNDMKKTFEVFDKSKHIGTIPYADGTRPNSNHRFFEHDGCLFYNPAVSLYSICKLDIKSRRVSFFGQIEKYKTEKETRIKNHRHILRYGDEIIAVPDCQPVVELYNCDGKLIELFNFKDIAPVAEMLKFIKGTEQEENSYYGFNEDAVVFKNTLYILIMTLGANNKPESNTILEFKIADNSFIPSKLLHLGKGHFNTINVSEKGIESYNTRMNQLKRYFYETK